MNSNNPAYPLGSRAFERSCVLPSGCTQQTCGVRSTLDIAHHVSLQLMPLFHYEPHPTMELYTQLGLAYGGACILYMLVFMNRSNRCLKVIFKILPLIILTLGNTNIMAQEMSAPFDIKPSYYLSRLQRFNWSLVFCMIGDAYLVFPSLFVYGLVSFAIAQGLLALMFSDDLFLVTNQLTMNEVISGLCVLVVTVLVCMRLYPNLKCGLVFPVLLYATLISFMFWSAIMQVQKFSSTTNLSGAAGAGFFYISDMLLALNKWVVKIPMGQHLVMGTYYTALFLIACFVSFSA